MLGLLAQKLKNYNTAARNGRIPSSGVISHIKMTAQATEPDAGLKLASEFSGCLVNYLNSYTNIDRILATAVSDATDEAARSLLGPNLLELLNTMEFKVQLLWHTILRTGYITFLPFKDMRKCVYKIHFHTLTNSMQRTVMKLMFRSTMATVFKKRVSDKEMFFVEFSLNGVFTADFISQCRTKWLNMASTLFLTYNLCNFIISQPILTSVANCWLQQTSSAAFGQLLETVLIDSMDFSVDSEFSFHLFAGRPELIIKRESFDDHTQNAINCFNIMGVKSFRNWIVTDRNTCKFSFNGFHIPKTFGVMMWNWRMGILRTIYCLMILLSYRHRLRRNMLMALYNYTYKLHYTFLTRAWQLNEVLNKEDYEISITRAKQVLSLAMFLLENAQQPAGPMDKAAYEVYMSSLL
ncbi:MAG: hypothetical protein JSS82_13885 [Bacteroidetes bacterium]|nr:hypothetical protein [Bacteroidota bacterium]